MRLFRQLPQANIKQVFRPQFKRNYNVIIQLHEYMDWPTAILTTTIIGRTLFTLPFAYLQQQRNAKLKTVQPVINAWKTTLVKLPDAEIKYRKKLSELKKTFNIQAWKSMSLPFLQIPFFVLMTMQVRQIVGSSVFVDTVLPGVKEEGILWMEDLSIPDPTLIAPIMIGLLHLANIEFNKVGKVFMRILSLVSVIVASQVSSGIVFYWLCSALYSLIQNLVFHEYFKNKV
ncbi:Cytochrome c oxidase assembly protein cox18, mitochondrial [Boothiomyces sp. JEL0866]|nr:Cytochrome c oxidase assembly protein cox18, mitochondrial [Boothiomyces sp. JEL0866]